MAVAFVSTSLLRLPSPCDRRELLFPAMGVRISGGWGIFPGVVSFPFCWGASIRGEDRRSNRACLSTKEASNGAVKIITVVGQGSVSPLKDSPWEEVMIHTANSDEKN
ncbi:hypothetical protein HPP92_028022 [Vanilla planifolia]|uniref:Uncharacterized protein n=1 Tax=Vanilla planifolia TaxID=51239 RepID=A0A835P7N7_VANPL|nr:hypothetical protein HPP92_028022 [Vanilla planifolia]KAG0493058.1 hypothetical protein HPP92_006456 [Vanilla planifolia]